MTLHQAEIERIAHVAYQCCVEWFGEPIDPQRKYLIEPGPYVGCLRDFQGTYTIWLTPQYNTSASLNAIIGHEMYHRITMRRSGVHKQVWIDEMLAFLASLWFLEAQGMSWYVQDRRSRLLEHLPPVSLRCLQRVRRRRVITVLLTKRMYPFGFSRDVQRLAIALHTFVERPLMTQLVGAKSLLSWVQGLPSELQAPVSGLLALPCPVAFPETSETYSQYAYAQEAIGEQEKAKVAYQKAHALNPQNAYIIQGWASCLLACGQWEEAVSLYHQSIALKPNELTPYLNIASVYRQREDFSAAQHWLERAFQCGESQEVVYYHQGFLSHARQDYQAAEQAWHQALALTSDPSLQEQIQRVIAHYLQGKV